MRTTPSVEESGGTRRRWCSTCRSFSWRSSRPSRRDMTAPLGRSRTRWLGVGCDRVGDDDRPGVRALVRLSRGDTRPPSRTACRVGSPSGFVRAGRCGVRRRDGQRASPVVPDELEQQVVPFVLALIIGGVCYLLERASQRSRATSLVFGVFALVLGLAVATLKSVLSAH